MTDKRRAVWRLKREPLKLIDECFRTRLAMFNTLSQNSKTGPKIMSGALVKREQMKDFVTQFLTFLTNWKEGHIAPDTSRFYADDVAKAIEVFFPDNHKAQWDQLCEEVKG